MPADLLRDVAQAGRELPVRRLSMLPLSIAAHAIVGVVVLLAPLAAEVDLPAPMRFAPDYMSATPVPPAPPPAPAPPGTPTAIRSDTGAPTVAPTAIVLERERPPIAPPEALGIIGGLGSGAGSGFGPIIAIEPPPPPAKADVTPTPVRPGGDIREPRKIVDVAPVYPPLARSGGVEGVVILEAVINTRGEVERLRVLRSVALLDSAAVDAVQRWRYTPTLLNGVPVPVLITITVRFTLR